MKPEEKVAIQIRKDLESNNLGKISDILSNQELYEVASIASISIGFSSPLVKKVLFSYIFFNQDKYVGRKMQVFFQDIVSFKENVSQNNKRMISFFLKQGIMSSSTKAREEFLKTYGYKSRTRYIKKNSNIDKIKFISFYQHFIKKIVSGIRSPKLKRFPHIELQNSFRTNRERKDVEQNDRN